MPKRVDIDDLQALLERGVQLVEVLPAADHEREHLPSAISIPLAELRDDTVAELQRDRPVVTYCYDLQCDLSARAAALLEVMGFGEVYDFAASKVAWFAMGLPAEGARRPDERVGAHAVRDVAELAPDDLVADAAWAFRSHDLAVVLADGVTIGVVRSEVLDLPGERSMLDVMQTAPPSVRPSITIGELAKSMDKNAEPWVLVTRSDGTYVGLMTREALDALA